MRHLKKKIKYCLQKYPETRNSDIKLTNSIWVEYYGDKLIKINDRLLVHLTDLYELPTQESVKRIRAKLNEQGLYLPTSEEVLKQRRLLEKKYRLEYSPSNPSKG
jgi:hypothetical protein